jgi:predicted AAA+ superfamily ATPase
MAALNQKLEALTNMLEATKRLKLTGTGSSDELEKEAEQFASLYEQRAEVVANIQQLDVRLGQYAVNGLGKSPAQQAAEKKIRETAKAMVELDRQHLAASEKLKGFLKGNLKRIRDGRGISNAYTDILSAQTGYHFDRAK